MATHTDLAQVWLVVSPHNPLKEKKTLAGDYDRLHLANLAVGDNPRLRVSNIEFQLPQPSYTIDTLTHLRERYPEYRFCLIMGSDSLLTLPRWKNYEVILEHYLIYVYRRPSYPTTDWESHPAVRCFDAPMMDISATFIRDCIRQGKSIRYLVPERVEEEIAKSGLYRGA